MGRKHGALRFSLEYYYLLDKQLRFAFSCVLSCAHFSLFVVGSDILAHKSASDENGVVTEEAREQVLERTSEYFAPELLNRLDSMLVFNKLSKDSILQVVSLRLNDVAERLKSRRITMDIDGPTREWLAREGYSDIYGARAIARVVRTKVLFPLAQKLLNGTIRFVFTISFPPSLPSHLLLSRDGDVVTIRVNPDSNALDIRDNHPPDASIGASVSDISLHPDDTP